MIRSSRTNSLKTKMITLRLK